MNAYRMIVKTETVDDKGRSKTTRETIPSIAEDQLDQRRRAARESAPAGSTRTIRVVREG